MRKETSREQRKLLGNKIYDIEIKNSNDMWMIKLRLFPQNIKQKYKETKMEKKNKIKTTSEVSTPELMSSWERQRENH